MQYFNPYNWFQPRRPPSDAIGVGRFPRDRPLFRNPTEEQQAYIAAFGEPPPITQLWRQQNQELFQGKIDALPNLPENRIQNAAIRRYNEQLALQTLRRSTQQEQFYRNRPQQLAEQQRLVDIQNYQREGNRPQKGYSDYQYTSARQMLIDEGVADPTDDQVIAKLQALQKEEDEAAKNAQRDDLKDIALQRLAGQPQVFNRWAAIGSIQNQAGYNLKMQELFGYVPDIGINQKAIGPQAMMNPYLPTQPQVLGLQSPEQAMQERQFQDYVQNNGPQLWGQLTYTPPFFGVPQDYESNRLNLYQIRRRENSIFNY